MKSLYIYFFILFASVAQAQQQFTIYFANNADIPLSDSAESLNTWIGNNTTSVISKVYGYTDKAGDSLYNIALSQRRVANIYEILTKAKIDVTGTELKSLGESEAMAENSAADRKVTIYYTQPKPVVAIAKKSESEDFANEVRNAERGTKLRIPNLNFYGGTYTPLKESEPALEELAKIMKANPKLRIEIQGHICCYAGDSGNLSALRARAVYWFLLDKKIAEDRMTYKGFGGSRPIYAMPEKSEEERITNRRVEIEIVEN
ncbi:OmpA family protein [Flavobacterium psychrotrophum]|uniref:OmpA family protein n=1 Tax=Flavobacterium psychrotrophum TaxID=2294119 RepID=UPI0013C3F6E3|nr:OmpA family protein [Flavobacterium psychrotrophum]